MAQRMYHRDELMGKALTAAMSGTLEEARIHMKDANKYDATDFWSHMISGQMHRFRGDVADALEDPEFAAHLDDSNLTAQYMLASAYHENGDVQKYKNKLNELSIREYRENDLLRPELRSRWRQEGHGRCRKT